MNISDKSSLETYLYSNADGLLFTIMADYHLGDDEPDKAAEICRSGLAKYPESSLGHYIWGLAAMRLSDINTAIRHFVSTVEMDPGFLQAYYKLLEVGKGTLDKSSLKKYYGKILQLNPFDYDVRDQLTELERSADIAVSKQPEIVPEEPAVKPEVKEVEEAPEIAEAGTAIEEAIDEQAVPVDKKSIEPKHDLGPLPLMDDEETHLGPIETESTVEQEDKAVEKSPKQEVVETKEPEPAIEVIEPSLPTGMDLSVEEGSKLNIDEMFSKLKSEPLEELQKQDWRAGVPKKKLEKVETISEGETDLGVETVTKEKEEPGEKVEPLKEDKKEVQGKETESPEKAPARSAAQKKKKVKSKVGGADKKSNDRIELKIPIPTLTLVEVLKNQKLYDQALEVLKILEARSKDVEKVRKARAEIELLRAKE